MQICKLQINRLKQALDLVWDVFVECDKPDYEEMGINTFHHFIQYENICSMVEEENMVFFGAYEENNLVGVIAMRNGFHISLLFVKPEFHRRGIATMLVRRAAAYCMEIKPDIHSITVNASPYGVKAYEAMGFSKIFEEQKKDGIRFTPMRINL